ncbi:Acetyltransferase (GNAT) family protein [Clostridiales bacterium CHKCI001]|nr:Acetyltransferase (GNAT) family protein [Clostridiales bacterium CHKCI001]
MQVQLREYKKQDFEPIKDIIRDIWHYDEFSSPKTASKLAGVFLSSCLTNYTFSRVAVLNGKVAGIILVKDIKKHSCPLSHRLMQAKSILSLYHSREGRKVAQIFKNVNGIDKQLLNDSKKSYSAELSLFAVSSLCQGQGLGKKLFQSALNYLKNQRLDNFFLFTDTSCNYGFYEHQGMFRRCEKEHIFNINGQSEKMNFFIYDYSCH